MSEKATKDSDILSERLAENVRKYIALRMEVLRLEALEKTAWVASFLVSMFVVLFILFFSFIFVNVAIAFVLADFFGSLTIGFGIFGIFYFILALLVIIYRKKMIEGLLFSTAIENILLGLEERERGRNEKD